MLLLLLLMTRLELAANSVRLQLGEKDVAAGRLLDETWRSGVVALVGVACHADALLVLVLVLVCGAALLARHTRLDLFLSGVRFVQ